MNTFEKIAVTVAGNAMKLYFSTGLYRIVSNVHRFFMDRRWKDVQLPSLTVAEAAERMRLFVWKRDTVTEFFDAVCTPQKVEATGFNGMSTHGNDCDEEAIWLSNVISPESHDKGLIGVYFFTVTWYEEKVGKLGGRFGGHNVCLLRYSDDNHAEHYRYMDYGVPREIVGTIDEVADQVISRYAGWDTLGHGARKGTRLCWCISSKDLVHITSKAF